MLDFCIFTFTSVRTTLFIWITLPVMMYICMYLVKDGSFHDPCNLAVFFPNFYSLMSLDFDVNPFFGDFYLWWVVPENLSLH